MTDVVCNLFFHPFFCLMVLAYSQHPVY